MDSIKFCLFSFLLTIVLGNFNFDVLRNKACFKHSMQIRDACPEGYESQAKCVTHGCCWDETFPTAFRCFLNRPQYLSYPTCDISYHERLSCVDKDFNGQYMDVSRGNCISNDCCYDDTNFAKELMLKRFKEITKNGKTLSRLELRTLQHEVINELKINPIPKCFVKQETVEKSCVIPHEKREICNPLHGVKSIENCLYNGCCTNVNNNGVLECFKKNESFADEEAQDCNVHVLEMVSAPIDGRDELGCKKNGFCYKAPNVCYLGKVKLAEYKKQLQIEELEKMKSVQMTTDEVYYDPKLNEKTQFCWATTYGRGVGKIPGDCQELDKQGLLCYPKCKPGYTGLLFVCWQNCPSGFKDQGAFCFKPAPYGRGFGYPWKFHDGFSSNGMLTRCNADNPELGCEMWGAVAYPKCKKGFHNVGCCICSPNCKDGQVDIGISCAKKTYTRKTILPSCESGMEYDAGLCYKNCKKGFNGIGPVCWGSCSGSTPSPCGLACAADHETCKNNIWGQMMASITFIESIGSAVATAGTSLVGKTSAKLAVKSAMKKVSRIVTKEGIEKTLKVAAKQAGNHVSDVLASEVAYEIAEMVTPENKVEMADFDPTGIVNVVRNFNHPVCTYD